MNCYQLTHLADGLLLKALSTLVSQERVHTATLLAHIGEVDERRLYLPAAYASMYMYCVHELHMSEDAAYKRIQAARAARRFPALFAAVADGRLHLSAVVLLAPCLTPANCDVLIAAAAGRTKAEVEYELAERFPKPDVATSLRRCPEVVSAEAACPPLRAPSTAVPSENAISGNLLVPEPVVPFTLNESPCPMGPLGEAQACPPSAVGAAPALQQHTRLAPLSPGRYALKLTIDQEAHDLLREAQELLGHSVPRGDVAALLTRALRALVRDLNQQKHAATEQPRVRRSAAEGRYIPAQVRREVTARDGGQCTFVSPNGRRCEARHALEFDHAKPLAKGGQTTTANLRLRCRAHNQYAAECEFGREFIRAKRATARTSGADRRGDVEVGHASDVAIHAQPGFADGTCS